MDKKTIDKVKDILYRENSWSPKEITQLGIHIEDVIEATEQALNIKHNDKN